MSWRLPRTVSALPTLLATGLAETTTYRLELIVWVLCTTAPLLMLPVWRAVAEAGAAGSYDATRFEIYFLVALVALQVTTVWAATSIHLDVRSGYLALRLMRPVHPVWIYLTQHLAALPLRLAIAVPVAIMGLAVVGTATVMREPWQWILLPPALLGAWAISFAASVAIGALGFWAESTLKVNDVWMAAHLALSGYLVPHAVLPAPLREICAWLPFRYQLGFPVELVMGGLSHGRAMSELATQWLYVVLLALVAAFLFRQGLTRHAAVGG